MGSSTTELPVPRGAIAIAAAAVLLLALGACELAGSKKEDTSTVAAKAGPGTEAAVARSDSVGGVPAVPADDSAARAAAASADTGVVELYPPQVRQGGVVFAFARGLGMQIPRCGWKGEPLPCYNVNGGVLATVPLPAEEAAGTFTLTFDRPAGRITRQVVVNERAFDRELIFLDESRYALLGKPRDVARDARAVRGILAGQSAERRWSGRWGEPLPSGKSAGYGAERFYYPASDSARAISLGPTARTRGAFGMDTSEARSQGAPGWRHAGVDIPAARGARVAAPAGGIVADVGDYTLTGTTVLLDHGQGVFTAYFHLDSALVQKGDIVRAGKVIGRVGDSGLATGPHLHYGLYIHGRDVDPAAWRDMPAFARGDTATAATGGKQ